MTFEEYLATVTPVRAAPSAHEVDDLVQIRAAALQISDLTEVTRATLESLVSGSPNVVRALGLAVGISFDSTGSKLTDAVREIEQMAEVRLPT